MRAKPVLLPADLWQTPGLMPLAGKDMTKRVIGTLLLAVALALAAGNADADGDRVRRHVHHGSTGYDLRLPPERHVIEVVDGWGRFIINGSRFTPREPVCQGWTAGDEIKFLAGEMHGHCATALIRNVSRRQTCEVSCGFLPLWF